MYFVSDTYEGVPLANPPITITDANPTATGNGACGPILITDPDDQTLEACDRANYRFGADWPRTYPTGGPKYYIQSAHDPNDWDWGEVPSADLANIIVPAGYSVDLYAMVPIGDGNAGQDCGNVGNIAGTVCDHSMGADQSANVATGDTDWVDTGFRFVEDAHACTRGTTLVACLVRAALGFGGRGGPVNALRSGLALAASVAPRGSYL